MYCTVFLQILKIKEIFTLTKKKVYHLLLQSLHFNVSNKTEIVDFLVLKPQKFRYMFAEMFRIFDYNTSILFLFKYIHKSCPIDFIIYCIEKFFRFLLRMTGKILQIRPTFL